MKRDQDGRSRADLLCLCAAIALLYAAERNGKSCFQLASDDLAVLVSEALNICAYVACMLGCRTFERVFMGVGRTRTWALVAAGVASSLGWAALAVGSSFPGMGALAWAGLALHSLADSVLLLACLCPLCQGRPLRAATVLPAALLLSGLALCVLQAAPNPVRDACTIVAPLLAVALYLARDRSRAAETCADADAANTPAQACPKAPDEAAQPAPTSRMPLWPFVLIAAYDLVCHFVATLDSASAIYGMLGYVIVPAMSLAIAVIQGNDYSPLPLNKAALPCIVAALACLSLPSPGGEVTAFLSNVASAAFYLFVLVTFIVMCQRHEFDPVHALGALLAVEHVGHFIGDLAGQLFFDVYPTGGVMLQVFSAVIATGIVVVATVFMNDLEVARIFGLVPQSVVQAGQRGAAKAGGDAVPVVSVMSTRESVAWQCAVAARAHGLTVREEGVLELMMLGMDNAQIAEEMCVLPGTVRTHVSHICRKLGTDSRAEAVEIARRA